MQPNALIQILDRPETAAAVLVPQRAEILDSLREEPGSAAMLSGRLGQPRQKINYHLRELEALELVELVEERRKRNMIERIMRPVANSWLVGPLALGMLAPKFSDSFDRLSASYLVAVAARTIDEIGQLFRRALKQRKKVPTFTIDTTVSFASADHRRKFAEELSIMLPQLINKYRDSSSTGRRSFRLNLSIYPKISSS